VKITFQWNCFKRAILLKAGQVKRDTIQQDGAPKIAKLPYFSGFMVDITIVKRAYNGL